jgi:hypothetical protein
MGRFYQQDQLGVNPIGETQNLNNPLRQYENGLNIYQYCYSMPLSHADPSGLTTIQVYTSTYFPWHKGFLIDGVDIDFGPDTARGWYYGKVPYGGYNASYAKVQNIRSLVKTGRMKYGPNAGKQCCSLTLRNAAICIKYFAFTEWSPSPYLLIGRNCYDFVRKGREGCCLGRYSRN